MARLHSAPSRQRVPEPTTPRSSANSATDDEAAAEQLLSETRASASKNRQPTLPSAVFGANLLNAARVDFRHSSPIRASRPANNHKLSRPSILAEQPRKAIGQRRSIWDVPESPEKGLFKLPEKVNHHPLKVVKTKRGHDKQRENELDISSAHPESEEVQQHGNSPSDDNLEVQYMPSSPPRLATSGQHTTEVVDPAHGRARASQNKAGRPTRQKDAKDVQIEERLSSGVLRCSAISYNPKRGLEVKQCLNASYKLTDDGPRCQTHVQKSATLRCIATITSPEGNSQCRQIGNNRTSHGPLCNKHLKDQSSDRNANAIQSSAMSKAAPGRLPATKRRSTDDADGEDVVKKRRVGRPSRKDEGKEPAPQRATDSESEGDVRDQIADTVENTISSPSTSSHQSSLRIQQPDEVTRNGEAFHQDLPEHSESSEDKAGAEEASDGKAESDNLFHPISKFFELEERPGSCFTKIGVRIKRICDGSTAYLEQDEDLSVESITDQTEDVRAILKLIEHVKEDRRMDFKMDAYNYLFRAAALYLQELHRWFSERDEDVSESLDAMYNLAPLVRDILSFKDTIASWKVNVGSHRQGDRTIKDVDIHLIAPLRKVEVGLTKQQRVLEGRERTRQQLADLDKELNRERELERQREEATEAKKKRWRHWQQLHIARMQCEPDPFKRRALVITRLEDFEEVDANGVQFERLPVFRNRAALPLRRAASLVSEKQWTEEEETALIDGLQRYSGPEVYNSIFTKFCKPGGVLRRFTVTDIVVKTSWVRSSWQKLQEDKGWAIPEWVTQIPLVP